jgi:hypothetical protein
MLTRLLASLWILFGGGLFIDAAMDTVKWHSNSIYSRAGLSWDWSGLGAGAAALVFGIWWVAGIRGALWFGYAASALFALYAVSFLIFGDEGASIYRFVLPLSVLALSIATVWQLRRS